MASRAGSLRRLATDKRGGVSMLVAGGMMMMVAASALAVDVGALYLAKRKLQGVADASALAAVATAQDPRNAAIGAIDANQAEGARLESLVTGSYTRDAALAPDQRFRAGGSAGDAVQVVLRQPVPLIFGRVLTGLSTSEVSVRATAARSDLAAYSIGSRLAAVDGGVPNALLSALTGSTVDLRVMDYQALASADVDLLSFSDALRTELRMETATFGETLNATATLPQALRAVAAATSDPVAKAALQSMALRAPPQTIALSRLIDLGPLASLDLVGASGGINVDAMSFMTALIQTSNGNRQVSVDLGLSLPGLLQSRLTLAIGERPAHSPWLTVTTGHQVIVRTAQARIYLETNVAAAGLGAIASLRVPLYVELASAEARLDAINCRGAESSRGVVLAVTPSIGQIAIAEIDSATLSNFQHTQALRTATLAQLPLIGITALGHVDLGGVTAQRVTFSASDIAARRVKTVSTGDVATATMASLLGRTTLGVQVAGLGLGLPISDSAVRAVLNGAAPQLDAVLNQVTDLVGLRLGQADVRVSRMRCGVPMLVG